MRPDLIERLRKMNAALYKEGVEAATLAALEIERLRKIEAAARNLVAQRGRHNTEVAYKRLEEVLK